MMEQPQNPGMNRRAFLGSVPVLAGLGMIGAGNLQVQPALSPERRSEELEQPFLGAFLRHPSLLPDYRWVPSVAFDDERARMVWALMRASSYFYPEVTVAGLSENFALIKKLADRPGGKEFLPRLLSVAAPISRLGEFAVRLTVDTDPRPISHWLSRPTGPMAADLS